MLESIWTDVKEFKKKLDENKAQASSYIRKTDISGQAELKYLSKRCDRLHRRQLPKFYRDSKQTQKHNPIIFTVVLISKRTFFIIVF